MSKNNKMVRLVLPISTLTRLATLSGEGQRVAGQRHDNLAAARDRATPEPALPSKFETEDASTREDRLRARHMRRVLNRPGPANWSNIGDRHWLARQRSPGVPSPPRDYEAIRDLAGRLEAGLVSGFAPLTLASSLRMRAIRQGLCRALLDAFANYSDADLRTVTVIYSGWSYTPAELDNVSAAELKAQFRRHLERAGILTIPGPLFAVLHGEFEARSGRYVLHYHLATTKAKAAALKAGLKANIKGYTTTATGASPIRSSRLKNRVTQLTYLAKAFWPGRPVAWINGKPKRIRDPRRIPEPYATQVLLWLDRQRFCNLVLTNECWSRRTGGTAAMRRLCLFVEGAG